MCVILIVPKEVRPSLQTLRHCERANPHGGGIAWRNAGAVEWIKTNDVEELDKIARSTKGDLVIHFRIASVGAVCDELRHPFPVTKNSRLDHRGRTGAVLFQNGTWGGYQEALAFAKSEGHRLPEGEMSDARAAAFLCSIYGHKFLAKAGHSRWVYFSAKELTRYGDWYKRDGIYFSNLYWAPVTAPYRPPVDRKPLGSHVGKQGSLLPETKMDRELKELWNMGAVETYWEKLHNHNKLLRERQAAERQRRLDEIAEDEKQLAEDVEALKGGQQ